MSELRRNLQYLKSLKKEREQKREQLQELEAQNAHLRKNPSDKLTNDLLVYSNNTQKDLVKEEISSIDKEIYRLNNSISAEDSEVLDSLDSSEIEEFREELCDIFPEPEPEPEPEPTAEPQKSTSEKKTRGVFSQLINGYKNIPKLVICSVISVLLLWTLFQWDTGNLLSYFNRVTRFNFFSFLLIGLFAFTVISISVYKDIATKSFGAVSDYFMLIMLICSLGVLGLYVNVQTTFKLLIFGFLAAYSLIYYALRLYLYQKDVKKIAGKNRFFKYYYNLFTSVSPLIIIVTVISIFVLLYLTMTTRLFRRWLASSDAHKPFIIVNIVLLALLYLYAAAFSIVRINEPKVYAIDLFTLLSELASVEFFVLNKFISAKATLASIIIVIATFMFALTINVYRIIKTKK